MRRLTGTQSNKNYEHLAFGSFRAPVEFNPTSQLLLQYSRIQSGTLSMAMDVVHPRVACGYRHSLLISDSGLAYGMGEGLNGEVGNDREQVCPTPQLINDGVDNDGADSPAQRNYFQVSAGAAHSIACTDDGFCYTWGRGAYGCLGHGEDTDTYLSPVGTPRAHTMPMLVRYLLGLDYDSKLKKDLRSSRDPVAIQYVSAGEDFSAAIDESGRVWVWGRNDHGNLGLGDNTPRAYPALVEGLLKNKQRVLSVSCGSKHMMAITNEGTAWAWGHGEHGKLGLGHTYDTYDPTAILALERDFIVAGSCGSSHTAAVDDSGNLYTWGNGSFGRLGHSEEMTELEPRLLMYFKRQCDHSGGGIPFITQVACGTMHTLAITNLGKLYSWGGGMYGKLGLGDDKNRLEPTPCLHLQNEKVTQIATGMFHSIVLTASGDVYSFGFGGTLNSRMGLGSSAEEDLLKGPESTMFFVPTKIEQWPGSALQMVRSESEINQTSYALTFTGRLRVNEDKDDGNISAMQTGHELSAMDIMMLDASLTSHTVIQVATGRHHTLFLTYHGNMYSCGENESGQLGLGHQHDKITPQRISLGVGDARIRMIACGARFCVATTARGTAFSWGECKNGQLGTGRTIGFEMQPTMLESAKSWRFESIACGEEHTGAITTKGNLVVWGLNELGQLGVDSAEKIIHTPAKVSGEIEHIRVTKLSLGMTHSACVTADGALYTWGNGWYGKLGHGNNRGFRSPHLVDYLSEENIVDVSCGAYHTLAVSKEGSVFSFGRGDYRLGHGAVTSNVSEPKLISTLWVQDVQVIRVCAGESHSVVIASDGCVYSWGNASNGKLGNATTAEVESDSYQDINEPQIVKMYDGSPLELGRTHFGRNMPDLRQISCRSNHTVALSLIGTVYVWGSGTSGRLGLNDINLRPNAVVVDHFNSSEDAYSDKSVKEADARNALKEETGQDSQTAPLSPDDEGGGKAVAKHGDLPSDFLVDLKLYISEYQSMQRTPSLYSLYRLLMREPKHLSFKSLTKLVLDMESVGENLDSWFLEASRLRDDCASLRSDLQVVLVSTLTKMYPRIENTKRSHKLRKQGKRGPSKEKVPSSILSMLGAYSQIIGMMFAHPCYLCILYNCIFGAVDRNDSVEHAKESEDSNIGRAKSPLTRLKDHNKKFFSLVKTIYNDISLPRHIRLFLTFMKFIVRQEISQTYSAYCGLPFHELVAFFFKSDSLGSMCLEFIFQQNEEHMNSMKTSLIKTISYLANLSDSIDVDPLVVAQEQRLITENQTKKMSKADLENYRAKFFTEKTVKNDVNQRSRILNGALRSFLQGIQQFILDLPYGAKFILTNIFRNIMSTLENFKAEIIDMPNDAELHNAVTLVLCRLFLRKCVTPFVLDAARVGLFSQNVVPKSSFKNNVMVCCKLATSIVSDEGIDSGPWYDGIRANVSSLQELVTSAISMVVSSTELDRMKKVLAMDLYREKLRPHELIYTVKLPDLFYLRWVTHTFGGDSLFDSERVKRADFMSKLTLKYPSDPDIGGNTHRQSRDVHDDPVRLMMAESIWGEEGLMSASGAVEENEAYEKALGVLPEKQRRIAINISIRTKWENKFNNDSARRCTTCSATLPPELAPANASPIRNDELYSLDIPLSMFHSKIVFRNMLRSGRVPPEISNNRPRETLKFLKKYYENQKQKALMHKLYKEVQDLEEVVDLIDGIDGDVEKLNRVIAEILIELNHRRMAYEKIHNYQTEVNHLICEIKSFRVLKQETKRSYHEYLHAMKHGQSEQQNRIVISMDARSEAKKCGIGGMTCFSTGELTSPNLVERVNDSVRPDVTAKKLGVRSMVSSVTMTFSYAYLKRQRVIQNFELGTIEDVSGDDKLSPADSMSVSRNCESILKLEWSPNGGRMIPGLSMSKLKARLTFKFVQASKLQYIVTEVYDKTMVIERFPLMVEEISALARRGVSNYRPCESNITFNTDNLMKTLAEIQMRRVMII